MNVMTVAAYGFVLLFVLCFGWVMLTSIFAGIAGLHFTPPNVRRLTRRISKALKKAPAVARRVVVVAILFIPMMTVFVLEILLGIWQRNPKVKDRDFNMLLVLIFMGFLGLFWTVVFWLLGFQLEHYWFPDEAVVLGFGVTFLSLLAVALYEWSQWGKRPLKPEAYEQLALSRAIYRVFKKEEEPKKKATRKKSKSKSKKR